MGLEELSTGAPHKKTMHIQSGCIAMRHMNVSACSSRCPHLSGSYLQAQAMRTVAAQPALHAGPPAPGGVEESEATQQ